MSNVSFKNRSCISKIRYNNLYHAELGVKKIYDDSGKLLRPYKCSFCKGYHLATIKNVDVRKISIGNVAQSLGVSEQLVRQRLSKVERKVRTYKTDPDEVIPYYVLYKYISRYRGTKFEYRLFSFLFGEDGAA